MSTDNLAHMHNNNNIIIIYKGTTDWYSSISHIDYLI